MEQRDDFAASFNQLSSEDQEHYGSPAAWEQAHRDIPEVTGYAITGVEETSGGAEVNVDLSLRGWTRRGHRVDAGTRDGGRVRHSR